MTAEFAPLCLPLIWLKLPSENAPFKGPCYKTLLHFVASYTFSNNNAFPMQDWIDLVIAASPPKEYDDEM